jgi:hypothetical protein
MAGGETLKHSSLKSLALAWAQGQGMSLAAPEVSFPHRKFRVDVAACSPTRKAPSRVPLQSITSILKVAAVFECKQARSDLIRDNKRRDLISTRLKSLEARRVKLEALLHLHLPHLANGESLLPEFDSYRLREYRHVPYQKLLRQISIAKRGLLHGTKFHRLVSYRLANLHYLVVEAELLALHEVPMGWGVLVRSGDRLDLISKPVWQEISVEEQLVFIQRIAARKAPLS